MTEREKMVELIDTFCKTELGTNFNRDILEKFADYLLSSGEKSSKMVYFPFPIECSKCHKVDADIGVCKEMDLLCAGKHSKYSKTQDWEFMCENCPHEVIEREYEERDEKQMGKTVFLTIEEAEAALKRGIRI